MAAKDRTHCWIVRIDGELFDALVSRQAKLNTLYRASRGKEISRSRLTRQILRAALKQEIDAARAQGQLAKQVPLFADATLERGK